MPDPLFTHTDLNDTRLTVTDDIISLVAEGEGTITTHAPTGDDAVALARAALAAAGDTGHVVVSTEESARAIRIRESVAAEDMRDRADQLVNYSGGMTRAEVVMAIRTLPLLPDDGEVQDEPDVHVATPEGITPCGQGHHDVTVTALISEATCLGCLRTLAQAPQDDLTTASQAACTERRLTLLEVAQGRVDRLHDRVDALEDRLSPPTMKAAVNPPPPDATFRLRAEHVTLLQRRDDFDPDAKRPYGSSDVPADVADLLDWYGDTDENPRMRDDARDLHAETGTALAVILSAGTTAPGEYHQDHNGTWYPAGAR